MERELALSLKRQAKKVAERMSARPGSDQFFLNEIIALSGTYAAVIYLKRPSEKKAVAEFRHIKDWENHKGGDIKKNEGWLNTWPTDSHIIGMEAFGKIKRKIEEFNFSKNFIENEEDANVVAERELP